MNANELRIGNYVNFLKFTKYGKIVMFLGTQTLQIDEPPFLEYEEDFLDVDISNIEPIQLTEDWLLKFGFEKIGRNFTTKDNFIVWLSLSNETYNFRQTYGVDRELKHVHQLQNLYFALTNNELIKK